MFCVLFMVSKYDCLDFIQSLKTTKAGLGLLAGKPLSPRVSRKGRVGTFSGASECPVYPFSFVSGHHGAGRPLMGEEAPK